MDLPRSAREGRLIVLESAGSTNDELLRIADTAPDSTVVVTLDQRAGRGRLGRSWVAPPGRTLAASVLLRPRAADGTPLPLEHFGWFPLLAGLAMTRAVDSLLPARRARLKWPNDVLVEDRKISGLLTELARGGSVVIGSGVNLFLEAAELPTPTSTSMTLEGATLDGHELVDAVLAGYLHELRALCDSFLGAHGDPDASGVRAAVSDACVTLGRGVRVDMPGGAEIPGRALRIDRDGRLVVKSASDGEVLAVSAGDVVHVRPNSPGSS